MFQKFIKAFIYHDPYAAFATSVHDAAKQRHVNHLPGRVVRRTEEDHVHVAGQFFHISLCQLKAVFLFQIMVYDLAAGRFQRLGILREGRRSKKRLARPLGKDDGKYEFCRAVPEYEHFFRNAKLSGQSAPELPASAVRIFPDMCRGPLHCFQHLIIRAERVDIDGKVNHALICIDVTAM